MRWLHVLWGLSFLALGCSEQNTSAPVMNAHSATSATPKVPAPTPPEPISEFQALISAPSQATQWPAAEAFMAQLERFDASMVKVCERMDINPAASEQCRLFIEAQQGTPLNLVVYNQDRLLGVAQLLTKPNKAEEHWSTFVLTDEFQSFKLSGDNASWSSNGGCQIICSGPSKPLLNLQARELLAYVRALLELDEPFYTSDVEVVGRGCSVRPAISVERGTEQSAEVDHGTERTVEVDHSTERTVEATPAPSPEVLYPDELERARHYRAGAGCGQDLRPDKERLRKAALSAKYGKVSWQAQLLSYVLRRRHLVNESMAVLVPPLNSAAFMLGHMLFHMQLGSADGLWRFGYNYSVDLDYYPEFVLRRVMKTEHGAELMVQVERILKGPGLDAMNEYVLLSFLKDQADNGDEAAQAKAKALLSQLTLSNPQLAPLFGLKAKPQ